MGIMIEWFNKLKDGNIIPVDQMLHWGFGLVLTLIVFLAGYNILTTFIVVTVIALLIEVYDKYFKSGFSWKDLIATEVGLFTGIMIQLIIKYVQQY